MLDYNTIEKLSVMYTFCPVFSCFSDNVTLNLKEHHVELKTTIPAKNF